MKNRNFLNALLFLVFCSVIIIGCSQREEKFILEKTEEVLDSGAIVVDSLPRGAQVYLGEEYKGNTPVTLYNIPVGIYDIIVKKEGYKHFKKTITVKVGRTEEIEAILSMPEETKPKVEEYKEEQERQVPGNISAKSELKKINLSSFSMYYDFDKAEFTELRTGGSDLFSRRYDTYVHFTSLTPTKIGVINKLINEVTKEDCTSLDSAVVQLYSQQTLCVKTSVGSIVAMSGSWQTNPAELQWKSFN